MCHFYKVRLFNRQHLICDIVVFQWIKPWCKAQSSILCASIFCQKLWLCSLCTKQNSTWIYAAALTYESVKMTQTSRLTQNRQINLTDKWQCSLSSFQVVWKCYMVTKCYTLTQSLSTNTIRKYGSFLKYMLQFKSLGSVRLILIKLIN